MVLALDATLLILLGAVLIVAPNRIELAFHFQNMPGGVSYLIGMWGCGLLTLAIGYAIAATNPVRHVAWVQVGIARGALECVFGFVCIERGIVTWAQSGVGIIAAGAFALAYIILYPGKE